MPVPSRIKPGYRAVTTMLRVQDIAEMERVADTLQRVGWANANRSFVIRAACVCFVDGLRDMSPQEILRFFAERTARGVKPPAAPSIVPA